MVEAALFNKCLVGLAIVLLLLDSLLEPGCARKAGYSAQGTGCDKPTTFHTMPEGGLTRAPWLATTIWNDILLLFQSGMPCKRLRIQMKFVDRCFSGSEAVNWLHAKLKGDPRLLPDITKEKISLLLPRDSALQTVFDAIF